MSSTHRITVARVDGIGPKIMNASIRILQTTGAPLEYDSIEIGEAQYLRYVCSGLPSDAWDTIRHNNVLLKAPLTTPQGGGFKSLNVTIRKNLNLFANVRQSKSYDPTIASPHPGMNLVIITAQGAVDGRAVEELLHRLVEAGYDVVKTENLNTYDGAAGYSLGQGE